MTPSRAFATVVMLAGLLGMPSDARAEFRRIEMKIVGMD